MKNVYTIQIGGMANSAPNVRFCEEGYEGVTFKGVRLGEKWVPPRVEVSYARKRLKDILGGMVIARVVSERFMRCFLEASPGCCEFLPLVEIRGMKYFVWNVYKRVDCLDLTRSDLSVDILPQYVFDAAKIPDSWCFKVPQNPYSIFVDDEFVRSAKACSLEGIGIANPENPDLFSMVVI